MLFHVPILDLSILWSIIRELQINLSDYQMQELLAWPRTQILHQVFQ
jgi:hypothetical protein